jgi:hypothetical protein
LNTLLLHCGLDESEKGEKERFLNGFNDKIHDVVVDKKYNSLNYLILLSTSQARLNK